MTIAIGIPCKTGVIIAADTTIISEDGSKSQTKKVETIHVDSGSYAIANASRDGNAAKTLVSQLTADLKGNPVPSFSYLEQLIADRMTRWASAFQMAPVVNLLIGARVNDDGTKAALYFCEPPNTIIRKDQYEWGGYAAIGAGAAITDPLYTTLFSSSTGSARVRLIQISYLMYRAKKDSALCGGQTTAAIIKHESGQGPVWIVPYSMSNAESVCNRLDFLLRRTADAVVREDEETVHSFVQHHAAAIVNMGGAFRELKFETSGGTL